MSSLNDSILAHLECPVCFEHIQAPICACVNGHLVCSRCRSQLIGCCLCRAQFAQTQNRFAERIAAALRYPCPNASSGCTEKLKPTLLTAHAQECNFDCRCLVEECITEYVSPSESEHKRMKVEKRKCCDWRGAKGQLKQHVITKHGDFYVSNGTELTSFVKVDSLKLVKEARLIEAFGEIFWILLHIPVDTTDCIGVVKHLGTRESASSFHYKMKFPPKELASQEATEEYLLSRITFRGRTVPMKATTQLEDEEGLRLAAKAVDNLTTEDGGIVFSIEIKRFKNPDLEMIL